MSTVAPPDKKPVTFEEFLAMPDDGMERWLIEGVIYPKEPSVTVRNRQHSEVEANIAYLLKTWLDGQPEPKGKIHSGEAGFRLEGHLVSAIGIDVAYASAELVAATDPESVYYDGPPVLAVEILSPSDKHEEIVRKINAYLKAGVTVWEVDPDFQRVSVHRRGRPVETFNHNDMLITEPELPGFRVAVARIFGG